MVMEYAERGNLFYYQNSRTVFPELEAFKYFYQTSQALKFLHSQDIIHRDLKVGLRILSHKIFCWTPTIM